MYDLKISNIVPKLKYNTTLVTQLVSAGFPSPAEDYAESSIDLNEYLIGNKDSTFFIRVGGVSMTDSNLNEGDVLIVDKSIEPKSRDIVIAFLEGEFTVKRFIKKNKKIFLYPENESFNPIEVKSDLIIWGVITYIIYKAN